MPECKGYLRFPHVATRIALRAKYNVLTSQLCRFTLRCTTRDGLLHQMGKLVSEMYKAGYDLRVLLSKVNGFESRFWRMNVIFDSVPPAHVRRVFWNLLKQDLRALVIAAT